MINNHLTFTFISDIHGHFQKTENLRSYVDSSDLIFCLGDLDEYNKFTQKAKDFLNFLNYTKKLRVVSGNTDPTSFQEYLRNNPNLSLERREKNEFNFFFCGFGGIVSLQETIRRIRLELNGKSVSEDTMAKLNSQYDNALFFSYDNGKLKTQPENDEMIEIPHNFMEYIQDYELEAQFNTETMHFSFNLKEKSDEE